MNKAAQHNDVKLLAWVFKNNPNPAKDSKLRGDLFITAVQYGKIDVLEWMRLNMKDFVPKAFGLFITFAGMNVATEDEMMALTVWCEQHVKAQFSNDLRVHPTAQARMLEFINKRWVRVVEWYGYLPVNFDYDELIAEANRLGYSEIVEMLDD